jgi:hypothetical protein
LVFDVELVAVKRIPHPVAPAKKTTPVHKKTAAAAKKTS